MLINSSRFLLPFLSDFYCGCICSCHLDSQPESSINCTTACVSMQLPALVIVIYMILSPCECAPCCRARIVLFNSLSHCTEPLPLSLLPATPNCARVSLIPLVRSVGGCTFRKTTKTISLECFQSNFWHNKNDNYGECFYRFR